MRKWFYVLLKLDAAKKEIEVKITDFEAAEAARQKQKRENEELRAEVEKLQGDVARLDKAKKKLQGKIIERLFFAFSAFDVLLSSP